MLLLRVREAASIIELESTARARPPQLILEPHKGERYYMDLIPLKAYDLVDFEA